MTLAFRPMTWTDLARMAFPGRGALANARAAVERDRRAARLRAEVDDYLARTAERPAVAGERPHR